MSAQQTEKMQNMKETEKMPLLFETRIIPPISKESHLKVIIQITNHEHLKRIVTVEFAENSDRWWKEKSVLYISEIWCWHWSHTRNLYKYSELNKHNGW